MNTTNKTVLSIVILLIVAFGVYFFMRNSSSPAVTNTQEEAQVRTVVENFGKKLQNVSLLAPTVVTDMQREYGDLVTSGLIAKWSTDPLNAPGRSTSSPWPDRIEIDTVTKTDTSIYHITGHIVEIATASNGGTTTPVARRAITLTVEKISGSWRITDVVLGEYDATSISGWKTYTTANGITLQYPDPFPAQYISLASDAQMPKIEVLSTPYSCTKGTKVINGIETRVDEGTINGRTYCVTESSEGAAGSVYTTYTYTTTISGKVVRGSFVLRSVQCANYEEPNKSACQNEHESFDLDSLVDRIAQTVRFR
jgi:hypothetical protein